MTTSPYVCIGAHGYIAVRDAEHLTADDARTLAADLIRLADRADEERDQVTIHFEIKPEELGDWRPNILDELRQRRTSR